MNSHDAILFVIAEGLLFLSWFFWRCRTDVVLILVGCAVWLVYEALVRGRWDIRPAVLLAIATLVVSVLQLTVRVLSGEAKSDSGTDALRP